MKYPATQHKRHRFPPEIIQYAGWLYYRFNLSHRDIEDLLARQRYLWRAVDQDGEVVDVLIQERRDATPARRFFGRMLARLGSEPRTMMRRFKATFQAQRFVRVHAAVSNLFNLGRHLIAAAYYRTLRQGAFVSWDKVVAI